MFLHRGSSSVLTWSQVIAEALYSHVPSSWLQLCTRMFPAHSCSSVFTCSQVMAEVLYLHVPWSWQKLYTYMFPGHGSSCRGPSASCGWQEEPAGWSPSGAAGSFLILFVLTENKPKLLIGTMVADLVHIFFNGIIYCIYKRYVHSYIKIQVGYKLFDSM